MNLTTFFQSYVILSISKSSIFVSLLIVTHQCNNRNKMKTNLILRTGATLQILLQNVNSEIVNDFVRSANFVSFYKWLDNQRRFFNSYSSASHQQLVPVHLRVK